MPEWSVFSVLVAAAVGGGVGLLSGIFGVGGGFLLVPLLNSVLGIPMATAVGSTACYTLGPATTAMLARRPRSGFIELPLILCGGLFLGVLAGTSSITFLKQAAPIEVAGRSIVATDLLVLASYAILMLGIAAMSLADGLRQTPPVVPDGGWISKLAIPPTGAIPEVGRFSIPVLSWTGLIVGFLSGFLGMSGGLVLVPAAIYLLGLSVHSATSVTIVIVWLVSLQSTLMHALHQNIELPLVAALLICGTIGAQVGTEFGDRIRGQKLKLGFGILVLVAAAIVIARLWKLWSLSAPAV
ncbi:MAG: sulfite exporter TauE/SafE family protein [Fuerstiella sp.]